MNDNVDEILELLYVTEEDGGSPPSRKISSSAASQTEDKDEGGRMKDEPEKVQSPRSKVKRPDQREGSD